MGGRKRKPTKLKVLEGTFRDDRANKNEPMPDNSIPEAPKHLSKDGRIEWDRISLLLFNLGLLSDIDRGLLALYCQAWGRVVKYEKIVAKEGELIKTEKGNIILSPNMWVINKAMEQCHKYLTEFGMSPASRAKVTANKNKKKNDKWEKFD